MSSSVENSSPWFLRTWPNQLLILGLALALLIPGTGAIPLMDRDEPRFAQATWEMMERGEWIIPYFNNEYRFDKPVGSYWWMRVHFWIFGKTELAARLHSVFSAWLTALVIQALGSFLYSRRAGFWAAVAWLTCLQILIHGRLCVADMPMLLGLTISYLAICHLLVPKKAPPKFGKWFWILCAGQVMAFLAKGPIALFVPILGLALAAFVFHRRNFDWMRLQPISFALIYLIGVGLWGIPALMETKGMFWQEGIGTHVVERGTAAFNGRVIVPGFYLISAFLSLLPWSAFFPAAMGPDRKARSSMKGALLLGWFLAPIIIFTPYATQLPHYIMPGFPAFVLLLTKGGSLPAPRNCSYGFNLFLRRANLVCFILAIIAFIAAPFLDGLAKTIALGSGGGLIALGLLMQSLSRSWFWTVALLITGGSTAFLVTVLAVDFSPEVASVRTLLLLAGGLFLIAGLFTIALRYRKMALIAPLGVAALVGIMALASSLRSQHPVVAIHELLETKPDPTGQREFRAWRFTEPSLVFYSQSGWEFKGSDKTFPTAVKWANTKPYRVGIFLQREWTLASQLEAFQKTGSFTSDPSSDYWDQMDEALPESKFERHYIKGLNLARSSWVEVLVVFPKNARDAD